MDWDEINSPLARVCALFMERDSYLLRVNANERSMTHRFAAYLQVEFNDFDVDCEYNRQGELPKTLRAEANDKVSADDTDATTVFPDTIVHRRGTSANLLVIEAKKDGRSIERDIAKLDAFKKDASYLYKFAVLLSFTTGDRPDLRFDRS